MYFITLCPYLHIFLWRYEVRQNDEDFFWTHQTFLLHFLKSCLTFTAWSWESGLQWKEKEGERGQVIKDQLHYCLLSCVRLWGVDMGVFTSSAFNRLKQMPLIITTLQRRLIHHCRPLTCWCRSVNLSHSLLPTVCWKHWKHWVWWAWKHWVWSWSGLRVSESPHSLLGLKTLGLILILIRPRSFRESPQSDGPENTGSEPDPDLPQSFRV